MATLIQKYYIHYLETKLSKRVLRNPCYPRTTHTSTMLVVKFTNSNRTSNLIGQIRTYAKNSDTFQRTCQYIIWQIIKPIVPFIVCIRIFTQLSNSAAYNIERFAYLADKRVALVIHIIRWTRDHLNTCSVWWWSLLLIRAGRPQCV